MSDWADGYADGEHVEKAADDPPPYPPEWGAEQRAAAYWAVVRNGGVFPRHQSGWFAILTQKERAADRHRDIIDGERTPYKD